MTRQFSEDHRRKISEAVKASHAKPCECGHASHYHKWGRWKCRECACETFRTRKEVAQRPAPKAMA